MTFSFKADSNNRKVTLQIKNLNKITREGMSKAFFAIGKDYVTTAKNRILNPPKTGVVYRIRSRKGVVILHQASAPGESPANRTGALKDTIESLYSAGQDSMRLKAGDGDRVPYAGFLEEGTKKIKPRPYLIPAIETNERNAIEHFEREIKKAATKK